MVGAAAAEEAVDAVASGSRAGNAVAAVAVAGSPLARQPEKRCAPKS